MKTMRKMSVAAIAAVSIAALAAPPTVKYGNVTFNAPATPEEIAAAKNEVMAYAKGVTSKASLTFKGSSDEATLAAAIDAFPDARYVEVDAKGKFSGVAPFAKLTAAKAVAANNIANLDLTPLAGLASVEKVSIKYSQVDDLSPLAAMPNLKELDAYGATLKDFSPLAAAPKLERVWYYATKMPPAAYDSLGTLKQVKKFHGGLSQITSLAWLREVPQAEELVVFAEKIEDFTPVLDAPNLTYFRAWNMDGGRMAGSLGDLSFLANAKKLVKLELPGSSYTDTTVIGTLPNIKVLDLSGAKQDIDLAPLANLQKLEDLKLPGAKDPGSVKNFDALANCKALKTVQLRGAKGVESIACLAACPALRNVYVAKGAFPPEEIDALKARKINVREN